MLSQPLFFVASAPWAGKHINLSPKGLPSRSFSILTRNTVAYIDATGSGCETISHIYENGRVTVMFCSFGVSPKIMRLFCKGTVVEKADEEFQRLKMQMGKSVGLTGARAIILLDVFKVQTSCGFGVPLIGETTASGDEEKGFHDRNSLDKWTSSMQEKKALPEYQRNSNFRSLDGLTGLRSARRARGQWMLFEDCWAWVMRIMKQWDAVMVGILIATSVMLISKSYISI